MKIDIGNYPKYWGPYQVAETLLFWLDRNVNECVYKFGEFLAKTPLDTLCTWIESKRKRKVNVGIDRWDTFSMDNTLGLIILPMLIQLKASKHGAPFVEDDDVPVELRSSSATPKENNWDIDNNHFARWGWVMDEMIWAFTQLNDADNDTQFRSGVIDLTWTKARDGMNTLTRGPNDTSKFDSVGYTAHINRITRGTTLFGKYFTNLWD